MMARGRLQTVRPIENSPDTTPRDSDVPMAKMEERGALKKRVDAARNKKEGDALDAANLDLKEAEKRFFSYPHVASS